MTQHEAGQELQVLPGHAQDLAAIREPSIVVAEAKRAAVMLNDIVSKKKKKVLMNGEQYLEFEDWQTVSKFYGVTPKVISTRPVSVGDAHGWEATAVAVDAHGREISQADAMCLNDEPKWSTRPKYEWKKQGGGVKDVKVHVGDEPVPQFQLRSMAQTRACARVLRQIFAWVVVLAGYQPTVAEELDESQGAETVERPAPPQEKQPTPGEAVRLVSEAQTKRFYALFMQSGKTGSANEWLREHYSIENGHSIPLSQYQAICDDVQKVAKKVGP
jgi:hypothetical protein